MLREDAGWALPHIQTASGWEPDLPSVLEQIMRELGIRASMLHRPYGLRHEEPSHSDAIWVLELHPSEQCVTGEDHGRWVNQSEFLELPLTRPEHRTVIERDLLERETGNVPEQRPAWSRAGWLNDARTWMQDQLDALGYEISEPVEQVKNWSISAVLRQSTNRGRVYLKATLSWLLAANEAVVTRELAVLFPGIIPTPIAVHPAQPWMLLPDVGDVVGWDSTPEQRATIIRQFGALQRASTAQLNALFTAGCVDRRLHVLADQIEPLLRNPVALIGLSASEVNRLRSLAPVLRQACDALAQYAVLPALMHGDLNLGNIAVSASRYTVFDWTDACVGHPFIDMFIIYNDETDPAAQHMLRDAYLSNWVDLESPARLLEAWRLAQPLCALHQAISYTNIMAAVEQGTQHELSGAADWLRKILAFYTPSDAGSQDENGNCATN